ncbi:hypothetical protein TD95_001419 [Thielaviopsis punctulata]|uniref:FAD/NAD(P)-binding domain-containing protein n=1 Tax=Thielaviopsis punctulata TaxID=72032 RepID=A0A0F4Z786_9PEZI|nr:hypothetical protein TD95_001419 [Thielaviopsis punctulata]
MPRLAVNSVAVIGAGPCGLAAAKYLLAEKAFSRIQVFDQRPIAGGLWNYTPLSVLDAGFTIPRTAPSTVLDTLVAQPGGPAQVVSPVYDLLETNIPKDLMGYTDGGFPSNEALFPHHTRVAAYLHSCAVPLQSVLRLQTQVRDVRKVGGVWRVTIRDLVADKETTEEFDAVVVASGHYNDPYIPDIKGLKEFAEAYPGAVMHSKFYQRPDEFKDKKVIVVGNSASGIDLSAQISTFSKAPVLASERTATPASASTNPLIRTVPEITSFSLPSRQAHFSDGSVESDIDAVVFCTGYFYSFPYLRDLPVPLGDGTHVAGLYEHVLYAADPSLSFLGVPQRIVPFPVAEAQSGLVARALAGRWEVPTRAEMEAWETELRAQLPDVRNLHTLKFPKDADYINRLYEMSASADKKEGLERDGMGKEPPYWGPEKQWLREQFPMIKAVSRELGTKRMNIRTLKELGFEYPGKN